MNRQILKRVVLIGLFLIPFVPLLVSSSLFFPFITTKAFAFRIIVEIIFGAWVLLALSASEYWPKRSKILYTLGIFLVVIGLADLLGLSPIKSFWSNFERMEGYITMLHLGALYLVMSSVFKAREWRWWWNTSLSASALMIVYCLFQLAGAFEIHQGGVRVDGTLGNAGYLALYLLIHVFVAGRLLVTTKDATLKWLYGLLIVGQVTILYLTATRGALLGFVAGLFVIAVLNIFNKENLRIRRFGIYGLVILVVLSTSFFLMKDKSFIRENPVLGRLASISLTQWKNEGRSFVWAMAIEGIKEKPILGWGQDNFNYIFAKHYSAQMYKLEPWFDRAHNIFLDWGVAGGILGLAAYLALYLVLLLAIWKRPARPHESGAGGENDLQFIERSVLTGLLAAYFFNNIFVFDNLMSYILFIALLAEFGGGVRKEENLQNISQEIKLTSWSWLAIVATVLILYFVNIKPVVVNTNLIKGLQSIQGNGTTAKAMEYFEKAYNSSRLGRPEVVEWIASSAPTILGDAGTPLEARNVYYIFATKTMEDINLALKDDPRYEMVAGSFYLSIGQFDLAIDHLNKAKILMPEKQQIYFSLGQAFYYKKDNRSALEALKQAYELAPEYEQARSIYEEALKQIPH